MIRLPPTPEDELTQWPFAHDLAENFEQLFRRIDGKSEEWIVLYDHKSARTSYSPRIGSHGFRQEEFRIVLSIVTSRVNTSRFIEYLETTRKIDVMHWNPPELIDGPYLREVAWRTTCPKTQWYSEGLRGVEDVSVAFPLFRYVWESHLDASLPEGARVYIPSPWLLSALRLSPDRADIAICRDESDEVRFIASTRGADGSLAVINA